MRFVYENPTWLSGTGLVAVPELHDLAELRGDGRKLLEIWRRREPRVAAIRGLPLAAHRSR